MGKAEGILLIVFLLTTLWSWRLALLKRRRISVAMTLSLGYFDFGCISLNGHDILLAFLQACVPVDRILNGLITDGGVPGIRMTSSTTTSCFDNDMDLDVDALTAQHLQGQADRETWMEKMSRRTGKVVSSLSEMSESFCETIWLSSMCGRE
jgi:hypothetical protein